MGEYAVGHKLSGADAKANLPDARLVCRRSLLPGRFAAGLLLVFVVILDTFLFQSRNRIPRNPARHTSSGRMKNQLCCATVFFVALWYHLYGH